jgi:hypothetical protein
MKEKSVRFSVFSRPSETENRKLKTENSYGFPTAHSQLVVVAT